MSNDDTQQQQQMEDQQQNEQDSNDGNGETSSLIEENKFDLPPNWVAVAHGDEYYFWNEETDETTWEMPTM